MRGSRADRETMTLGSTGRRGGIKGWKREGWVYPLLKRVVRRALLEVLSRLNGATEGNIESITSVSLIYSPPLSLFLPPHFLSHPLSHPYPLSSASSQTWEVIIAQSANQINSHLRVCGRPRNCDLYWEMSFITAVMSLYLLPSGATHMALTQSHAHAQDRTYNANTCLDTTKSLWHLAFMTHSCIGFIWNRVSQPWQLLLDLIPLNCYSHNCTNRLQCSLLPTKTSFTLCLVHQCMAEWA